MQRREYVVVVDYNGAERARDRGCVGKREKGNKLVALEERVGGIFDLVANSLSQNGTPPPKLTHVNLFVTDRRNLHLQLPTAYMVAE